ncbi:MAG: hypothetical protein PHI68_03025 [Candidatus Cloacimonetes bacterium]|nr:hypothetical protein [Candidatus Cloacimonadota bacterium]
MKQRLILSLILMYLGINLIALDNRYLTPISHIKNSPAYSIFAADQKVIISAPNQLWIWSMFNPWRPQLDASYFSTSVIEDYDLMAGKYLYICSREPTNNVFEIDSLNTYGKIYFPYQVTGDKITREGSLLFVADQARGIDILDIGSGGGREIKSVFSEKWGIRDFIAQYPYIYALNDFGFVTIDISDLQFPLSLGRNYQISDARIIRKNGDVLWIGAGKNLMAINTQDLSNPTFINQFRFAYDITDLEIKDNRAYVVLGYGGLRILEISKPLNIQELSWINLQYGVLDVALENDFIYLALGKDGWMIYEYR